MTKQIDCPNWSPWEKAGRCAKGYYGGRPSLGTCTLVCQLGKNPTPVGAMPLKMKTTGTVVQGARKSVMDRLGPVRWRTLHCRALKQTDLSKELVWLLGEYVGSLPCAECRAGLLEYIKTSPPNLSSPTTYFQWGVEFHNAVNARLNKAIMTVEDARKHWSGIDVVSIPEVNRTQNAVLGSLSTVEGAKTPQKRSCCH